VSANWDHQYASGDGVRLTTLLLASIYHLWRRIADWADCCPLQMHLQQVSPIHTLLGPHFTNVVHTIDQAFKQWLKTFKDIVSCEDFYLEKGHSPWHRIKLPDPFAPTITPIQPASNNGKRQGNPTRSQSHDQRPSQRQLQNNSTQDRPPPIPNNNSFSCKYLEHPLLELVDTSCNEPGLFGKHLSGIRTTSGTSIPKITEKTVCFL
jgi:hypothetical protein